MIQRMIRISTFPYIVTPPQQSKQSFVFGSDVCNHQPNFLPFIIEIYHGMEITVMFRYGTTVDIEGSNLNL